MDLYSRFEIFTRTFGLQIQDSPPIMATNDPTEAFSICRVAMKREEGTLDVTSIRDVITRKEYSGVELFQFANEFAIRRVE